MKRNKAFLFVLLTLIICVQLTKYSNIEAKTLYDNEKILEYIWNGNSCYQESVTVIENEDGSISPISLLYNIDCIVEVKSASLLITYTENVDYIKTNDGKLQVIKTGTIPRISYNDFHPVTGSEGFESRDGGYVLWKEGSWFHERQVVVTYTHSDSYDGYIPEGKGRLLSKVRNKLLNGQDINLLVYGDSVSTGGNSSGHPSIYVSPYMSIYPNLFVDGLKQQYGVKVNIYNESQGGMDSNWGLSNLRNGILNKYPNVDFDLAIIAFGGNDTLKDKESLAYNLNRIGSTLMSKYKNLEVMLMPSLLPNYEAVNFYGHQYEFYDGLLPYEKDGVVAINVVGMHQSLLNKKRYVDMTGNNVNHLNDYLARVYAQTLLKSLEISDYKTQKELEIENTEKDDNKEINDFDEEVTSNKKGCYSSYNNFILLIPFILISLIKKVGGKDEKFI